METNIFGKKIKDERIKNNMSIKEVSIKTSFNEKTLMDIENGVLFPNIKHLTELSKVFNKNIGYFLSEIIIK